MRDADLPPNAAILQEASFQRSGGIYGCVRENIGWKGKRTAKQKAPKHVSAIGEFAEKMHRVEAPAMLRCVYFLVKHDHIVYVGQSTSIGARLESHRKDGKEFDYALVLPVDFNHVVFSLSAIESAFIRLLDPPLNGPPPTQREAWDEYILGIFSATAGAIP
jgi:hypothetical protein